MEIIMEIKSEIKATPPFKDMETYLSNLSMNGEPIGSVRSATVQQTESMIKAISCSSFAIEAVEAWVKFDGMEKDKGNVNEYYQAMYDMREKMIIAKDKIK